MKLEELPIEVEPLAGAMPVFRAQVAPAELTEVCGWAHAGKARLVALGVAFAAIFGKVQPMVFGETSVPRLERGPALVPVFAHLAIVLVLGLYIPPYLVGWYRQAAALIG